MNVMKNNLFVLCCTGAGLLSASVMQAKEKPRNVLFILVDDYGWNDTLGAVGFTKPRISTGLPGRE